MTTLAADSMEGRYTGSRGANKAAAFIAAEMKSLGLKPGGDSGTFMQKVPFAAVETTRRGPSLQLLDSIGALNGVPEAARRVGYNVIGIIPGSDPAMLNEVVAFAAHYDGLGIRKPVNGDSIYNGADDDASGVVTVLEIARVLAKSPAPKRTILFMLTTGEEQGILGTKWYVDHPVFPLSQMVAEMEVEMAGRPDSLAGGPGKLWMTGFDRSTMGSMLKDAGIPIVADPYPRFQFFERSDNIVFARKGIPAHTLSSYNLHTDYHAPSDEIGTIDFAHLTSVARIAAKAARLIADGPPPRWNPGGQPAAR
jgi:Zn-dependent M28 family amino/carboxypeptidase